MTADDRDELGIGRADLPDGFSGVEPEPTVHRQFTAAFRAVRIPGTGLPRAADLPRERTPSIDCEARTQTYEPTDRSGPQIRITAVDLSSLSPTERSSIGSRFEAGHGAFAQTVDNGDVLGQSVLGDTFYQLHASGVPPDSLRPLTARLGMRVHQ
jgi:hypothetical protein